MIHIVLALVFAFLLGCSDSGSSPSLVVQDQEHEGFFKIAASGKSVKLGQKASFKAEFTYDYLIGSHEVTCGEYKKLVHSIAVEEANFPEIPCENDSVPVTNVTFYDAVLYANALSKADGLDTAYSFTSRSFDSEGHCENLTRMVFNPEVEAYRLPTEAEWVYAANSNWNAEKSWNASNSDYKAHPVCTASTKTGKFCDFAGNAMEWVNDLLGDFRDTVITNFVGNVDGGSFGERVVKGGSFRSEPGSINVYSQGDVYKVTSSTRADYVGFRLAFGRIPNAVWISGDGIPVLNSVSLLAGSADIRRILGTYRAKLAFRNDVSGNLAYVDYANSILSVVEIFDTINVYHPEISPDGNWVAFCTGLEGITGKSSLYVRHLDREGSRLVKLDVESAAIPRWYVENGDTVIVYVSEASNNATDNDFFSQSTWKVSFSGGKFGTPERLMDGNYHGGMEDDFAVTGARLLRAHLASSGKSEDVVWYDGKQACNASLARDGSKRTLFLDFGEGAGQSFSKTEYGVHEQLLLVDSTGSLIHMVPAPNGYSFDHTEWISGVSKAKSNLVVATLTDQDGVHGKIILQNLADSSVVELVQGSELWHPSLWVKQASVGVDAKTLNLDSAGVYMKEGDEWGPIILRYKMELLWRYRDSINVAIMGSSRPLYSISPAYLSESFFAVNFAHTPNSIFATRDYLNRYLWNHLKNLKYLVISLDIDFWWKVDENKDNFFISEANRYPGYAYDSHHDNWNQKYPEGLLEAVEDGIGSEWGYTYTEDRGRFTGTVCGSWGDNPEIEFDSTYFDSHKSAWDNSFAALKDIIEAASERGIVVVGMIFPQSPAYRNTGAFGRYGLRRSLAEKWIEEFRQLDEESSNFVLMDENKMGLHDYPSSSAVDFDHLCGAGVGLISSRLDSLLLTLEAK